MSVIQRTTQIGFSAIALASFLLPAAWGQSLPLPAVQIEHPNWVHVPGALIRPDCVYEVPKGAEVSENGDVKLGGLLVAHHDDCPEAPIHTRPQHGFTPLSKEPPTTGNGWVEAVQEEISLSPGDNLDEILGTWVVPSAPSTSGGLIYIFNGLEPTVQDLIIQPVLQYGYFDCSGCVEGGALGGNFWVIASWMVGKNAYHSPAEKVSPGDTIQGTTNISSVSGGKTTWKIDAKDLTSGAFTYFHVWDSGYTWNWAYAGTLEAYNINTCSDFPASGSVEFKNNAVYHGYPNFDSVPGGWYGAFYNYFGGGGPSCSFSQEVTASGNYLKWNP